MIDSETIGHSRRAAREQSAPVTRQALAEAIEAERQRLAGAERDPAAEARANIVRLEAELQHVEEVDAERADEQEQLAERWRDLAREMAGIVPRLVEIGTEMDELNLRDLRLTSLRAAADENPGVARYQIRRLECQIGGPLSSQELDQLALRVRALELTSDRVATPFVVTPVAQERPHYPLEGDRTKPCMNCGEAWPCETATRATAARMRDNRAD